MKTQKIFIYTLLLLIILISGCGRESSTKASANSSSKQTTNKSSEQIVIKNNSIPFKYIFAGFVITKQVYAIPIGTQIIRTEVEWNDFKSKYLQDEDIPDSHYASPLNFNNEVVIYQSALDAKADAEATASQINNIKIVSDTLDVEYSQLPSNFRIVAVNPGYGIVHRYVLLVTIDKKYISNKIRDNLIIPSN
jgi:hypothetical protein